MVDWNVTLLEMVRRICEITVTLDFIFRLVLCSHEDVSFNIICLNVLEGIIQFYLSMCLDPILNWGWGWCTVKPV